MSVGKRDADALCAMRPRDRRFLHELLEVARAAFPGSDFFALDCNRADERQLVDDVLWPRLEAVVKRERKVLRDVCYVDRASGAERTIKLAFDGARLVERRRELASLTQRDCVEQLRAESHYALLLHSTADDDTRLVFLERYLALDVLAYTYAVIETQQLPVPPAFEAFASAAWPARCWPSRRVRSMCRQAMPRFFADRVFCIEQWQRLAEQVGVGRHEPRQAEPAKPAAERLLELQADAKPAPRPRWLAIDADARMVVRQEDGGDALDSSTGSLDSLEASELRWSTADGEQRGETSNATRAQNGATRRAAVELDSDARRGVAQRHEYWDRLRAPGAELRMRGRMGRVLAAALHLFLRVSDEAFDAKFTQVDLFYLSQLMSVECFGGDTRRVPRLIDAKLRASEVAAQCSERLRDAARRVSALPYTFLMHQIDAPHRYDYACAMAYEALYGTLPAYHLIDLIFDEIDVPALLERMQVRGWAPARHQRSVAVRAERASRAALDAFVERNALVYDAQRLAALDSLDAVLRVPLNTDRKRVGARAPANERRGSEVLYAANAVTPHALQTSVRAALPNARDGLDYLVVYTPLSYVYEDDRRYAHCARPSKAAADSGPSAVDGAVREASALHGVRADSAVELVDLVAQRAVHEASAAEQADASAASVAQSGKRRRGRPSKKDQLARQQQQELDEARAHATTRTTLAEPALYVALSARARDALQANTAPLALLQRALGKPAINRHVPLAAPSVARLLAESTNVGALCTALNALSVLVGGAAHEWRADSYRARHYAVRCARLVVRLVDFHANTMVGAGAPIDGGAFSLYSLWAVLSRYESERAEYAERRRRAGSTDADIGEPRLDNGVFAALAVVLNAEQLPVACERASFDFVSRACTNERRLEEHARFCAERAKTRDRDRARWHETPAWYRDMRRRGSASHAHGIASSAARRRLEAIQERTWFEDARAKRVGGGGGGGDQDAPFEADALCVCGGVGVEDCAGMARAYAEGIDSVACCVCTLAYTDGGAYAADSGGAVSAAHGLMVGACSYCRTRVPWRRTDDDRLLAPTHIEISTPLAPSEARAAALRGEAPDERRVGALALIERMLDVAAHNAGRPTEQAVQTAVRRALGSLCFRLRRWRSAPQHPHAAPTRSQSSSAALGRYAQHLAEAGEQAGANQFALWRERETGRGKLRAAHRSVLDATDALRRSDAPAARREPSDALAFLLGSLEAATFLHHRTLMAAHAKLANGTLDGTPYAAATARSLRDMAAPFSDSGALRAYERAFERRVTRQHVPLCDAAFAESSAIGANAFDSLASEWRRDADAKHDHMLFNGALPRPLAGALPLLSELTFLNWYEPEDAGSRSMSTSSE